MSALASEVNARRRFSFYYSPRLMQKKSDIPVLTESEYANELADKADNILETLQKNKGAMRPWIKNKKSGLTPEQMREYVIKKGLLHNYYCDFGFNSAGSMCCVSSPIRNCVCGDPFWGYLDSCY